MKKLEESDLYNLAETAMKAAGKAAEYIKSHSGQPLIVSLKEGIKSKSASVVTEVDLKCQEIILETLKDSITKYDLGMLTEESDDNHSRLVKDFFWCIDPMDGTLAFTENRPGYSVSISLVSKEGKSVIGVIFDPLSGQIFKAIKGQGVQTVNVTARNRDKELFCFLDSSIKHHHLNQLILERMENVKEELKLDKLRVHYGFGAVMNACSVFNHENAVYFKFPKKNEGGGCIWDFAATTCLFEESGMQVCDIMGNRLDLNNPDTTFMNHCGILFASNRLIGDGAKKIYLDIT